MYSYEDRLRAVRVYLKLGRSGQQHCPLVVRDKMEIANAFIQGYVCDHPVWLRLQVSHDQHNPASLELGLLLPVNFWRASPFPGFGGWMSPMSR